MVLPLPEPMPVGAHIRLFRWSLLVAGVIYGFNRKAELKALETKLRNERLKHKAERDARLAEEKRIASDKEMKELVALFFPDDD